MLTFPDVPRTFPGQNLGTSILPEHSQKRSQDPKGIWERGNVLPSCWFLTTFPGRSQTDDQSRRGSYGGAAPRLERIVQARGNVAS
jgi:hypothetical protein